MKKPKFTDTVALLLVLILTSIVTGCEKDNYNPGENGKPLPPKEGYFSFNLRGDVQLSVDYKTPGFKTLMEVYAQNPMMEDGKTKKEGVNPIYSAYTNNNSQFEGKINVPTALDEAYLYTNRWGLPVCVKLTVSDQGLTYDASTYSSSNNKETKGAVTRAPYDYVEGDKQPYTLKNRTTVDNLYSLGRFDLGGYLYYTSIGDPVTDYTPNYLTKTSTIKDGETISDLLLRTQAFFNTYNGRRNELLKPASVTNTKVTKSGKLDLVFLADMGSYYNSFGYYYYKEGNAPKTEADFKAMKKYLIMPFVQTTESNYTTLVRPGDTVGLKYFGEDGKQEATDIFPAGTVIGWFVVSNGWNNGSGKIKNWSVNGERIFFFSNDEGKYRRFVAVKDAKTDVVILGCEDRTVKQLENNEKEEDYSDILFFVKSDYAELDNENKPIIPDPTPELPDGDFTVSGTLAFEDIWPAGGDYDLNDVIVEYERVITFDNTNTIKKVTETFKPVQKAFSASQDNFFACKYSKLGVLNTTLPDDVVFESKTNSIVVTASARTTSGKSYVIERDMKKEGLSVKTTDGKNSIEDGFNPYIITRAYTQSNRIEVHLPLYDMTEAADKSKMTEDNAYYVSAGGIYPFAIDIPISGFIPADEWKNISSEGQYPKFRSWAESKGANDTNWYLTGKGAK